MLVNCTHTIDCIDAIGGDALGRAHRHFAGAAGKCQSGSDTFKEGI